MDDNFKSLILISDRSQLAIGARLYKRLSIAGKKPFILNWNNIDIGSARYSIRIPKYYQEAFKIDYFDIRMEAYNLFHSLAGQILSGDATLIELTKYKGVSLWELSKQYILSQLMPLLYDFNMLEAILKVEKISEVYLIDTVNNLERTLELICRKRGVSFSVHRAAKKKGAYIKSGFLAPIIFIKRVKRFMISFYFFLLNLVKFKRINKKYNILFFTDAERFFISMLPVIFKYNDSERLVINTFLSGASRKMKENGIFYTDFYGYKLYGLYNRNINRFLKKMKNGICDSEHLSDRILYKEVQIEPLLKPLLTRIINEEFLERIRNIDIIRKIISSHKPGVIVAVACSFDIIIAAKSMSIPVVAIQSAHPLEFVYFGSTVADVITVDSNYWKEYLSQHNVDSGRVLVTGAPKLDFLQKTRIREQRQERFRSSRIVVYATNYASLATGAMPYEKEEQVELLFSAIKNIKDVKLVIKMHPYDNDDRIYKRIARKKNVKDYTLIKDVEMLKLLNDCDLLITHISTASYEAVLMNKNVILLCRDSYFCRDDVWDFQRFGAVINASNAEELELQIKNTLFCPETIARLEENRRKYINAHGYPLDGKATERIKEVIDKFMQ